MTTSVPRDERTSMQDVLPPYRAVVGPGFAIDPRVPQKRTFKRFLNASSGAILGRYGPNPAYGLRKP
jgi:hypothetical protein